MLTQGTGVRAPARDEEPVSWKATDRTSKEGHLRKATAQWDAHGFEHALLAFTALEEEREATSAVGQTTVLHKRQKLLG